MGTRLFLCIFYSFLVDLGDGVLFWYIWKKISGGSEGFFILDLVE